MAGNAFIIPHFVSASSPEGLMREMLAINMKKRKQLDFFAVQFDGENWVAWYYAEIKVKLRAKGKKVDVEVQA